MSSDEVRSCSTCGASVYSEHIEAGIAGYAKGELLCAHCLADATVGDAQGVHMAPIVMQPIGDRREAKVAESSHAGGNASAVGAAAGFRTGSGMTGEHQFKRPLLPHSSGATRCRTFHSRLNDAAIAYMNDGVNEWIDKHPEVTVKFATSTIGTFEGKHAEPNLIMTVFY